MWRKVRTDDAAEIVSGGTPSRFVPEYWDGAIPWVTPTDISASRGKYLSSTAERITKKGLSHSAAKLLPAGTVLLTSRATIGEARIATMQLCTNQGFKSLIAREGVDSEFLYYQVCRQRGDYERYGVGSTFAEINKPDTSRVELLFPETEEKQQAIAGVLSTVDRLIYQTETLIAKQEQVRAGLMQDLFTRGVDKSGRLRPSHEEAPELYHETELGWLPKAWEAIRLDELTTKIVDGVHHTPTYVDTGIPFVTVKNLTKGRGIDLSDVNYVTLSDHRGYQRRADPKYGDVLVTKDGTLGVARCVPKELDEVSIFVSVALLRPILSRLIPAFLREFFETNYYSRQMGYLSAGSGLKHIHLEHFRKFVIPLPHAAEQAAIIEALACSDRILEDEDRMLAELMARRSGLMQDLLTGKVPVDVLLKERAAA
ncbi:MAG TPA: restriction endonuclease subunit S [Hyphomonadaceae bacterium]|nr:restriction endonuclease subunit S [Hyphomonadaceae bacterium]HPI48666.1 restriction endonuclease subunit S [Hyphomonadaceae bacterium]